VNEMDKIPTPGVGDLDGTVPAYPLLREMSLGLRSAGLEDCAMVLAGQASSLAKDGISISELVDKLVEEVKLLE